MLEDGRRTGSKLVLVLVGFLLVFQVIKLPTFSLAEGGSSVISASKLLITDTNGRQCAELGYSEDSIAFLRLGCAEDGNTILARVSSGGASVGLVDTKGQQRLSMTMGDTGASAVTFCDGDGVVLLNIALGREYSGLALFNHDRSRNVELAVNYGTPSIAVNVGALKNNVRISPGTIDVALADDKLERRLIIGEDQEHDDLRIWIEDKNHVRSAEFPPVK